MVSRCARTAISWWRKNRICATSSVVRMPSSPNGSSGWRTTSGTREQLDANWVVHGRRH